MVASEASHEAAYSGKVASDGASNEEPTPGAASSSSAAGSPNSLTPMSDEHSATDSARDIVESGSAMCSKSAGAGNLSGNALASGDSHAKYKSVEKEKLGEELPNLKASIYFKLSGGRSDVFLAIWSSTVNFCKSGLASFATTSFVHQRNNEGIDISQTQWQCVH